MPKPKFLIVLTSEGVIPTNRAKTGWYLSEFAHPYTILSPHFDLVIASPQGGEAPLDPASVTAAETADDKVARRFLDENRGLWTRTVPLREVIKDVEAMYDLSTNPTSLAIIQSLATMHKTIAAVCHGPVALLNATAPSGIPLLGSTTVTGFSNEEEQQVGMNTVLPFELETELNRVSGGGYVKAKEVWGEKVVVSEAAGTTTRAKVVTGQNPASAAGVAREVLRVQGLT